MPQPILFSLVALISLLPALLAAGSPGRREFEGRQRLLVLVAAVGSLLGFLGPLLATAGWPAGFSVALWLSLSVTLTVLLLLSFRWSGLLDLSPLLMPYLFLLGLLATVWSGTAQAHRLQGAFDGLFLLHVLLSLLTYAATTLAAVAGVAVLLQQAALKSKRPTRLTRRLPALAEGEAFQVGFLKIAETVLGVGIVTGIAIRLMHNQPLIEPDHKTLLSLAAFALIGLLLLVQTRSGLRGQRAARLALGAYLLLTLSYPGVKFVTDVLLAS
ncbi:cytochrome c biogenesis protein CcsA [Limibacillus sp. MBR-115]|jgi:ABC-type uncharacterized transport system permease subunit|uniref:cytochrome c biogenesis protein CcsA n=1 Tax=Limibacillus sp. MBR-115 TaxID=3156465 RepID=UPI00339A8C2D